MQRWWVVFSLLILALLGSWFFTAAPAGFQDSKETRFLLGTIVEFTVSYVDDEAHVQQQQVQQAIRQAVQAMQDAEAMFTTHGAVENSVQLFNRASAGQAVLLDAPVVALLQQSLRIQKLSKGAFDPVLGDLNQLWGFSGDSPPEFPPSDVYIQRSLEVSGATHVQALAADKWSKDAASTQLDFGAIAKGLAIDQAMMVLQNMGVEHAIINAGGDLRVLGKHGDKPWKIAIRHPRHSQPLGWFAVDKAMSIVTSGDYERFFMVGGKRYHHILNPKTGRPARASQSVTVVATTAAAADAWSTAMFVLGAAQGLPMIEKMADVEAIWVDKDGQTLMSSGMKNWFHLFQAGGKKE